MAHPLGDGDPIIRKANWLGRYLEVERKFDDKLKDVLSDAVSAIDDAFGNLTKDNISSKVRRAQLSQSNRAIRKIIKSVFGDTTDLIRDHQQDAAVAAVDATLFEQKGVLARLFSNEQERKDYADVLRVGAKRNIEAVMTRVLETEKPLSQRVYNTEALATGQVSRTINRALAKGDSAADLARDVRALIDPNVPGGVSYAAKRLGRTEINNAFHAQAIHDAEEMPWITGMDWNLSKTHTSDPGDECEEYAKIKYFPFKPDRKSIDIPGKPHPNCRCYITPSQQKYEDFEKSLLNGEYDDYLDQMLGVKDDSVAEEIKAAPKRPVALKVPAPEKPLPISKPKPIESVEWDGPNVVRPNTDPKVQRDIYDAWTLEAFDKNKASMRLGAQKAQENGWDGLPKAYVTDARQRQVQGVQGKINDKKALQHYGAEIVSRAVHSKPTTVDFFRGMQVTPEILNGYQEGKDIAMSLSSFSNDSGNALDFAMGVGEWTSKDVPKNAANVMVRLKPGARLAQMDGAESIGFGRFVIDEILPEREVEIPAFRLGRKPKGSTELWPKTIVVRQVSMVEKEVSKGLEWTGPKISKPVPLAKWVESPSGKFSLTEKSAVERQLYDSWSGIGTFDSHKVFMRDGARRAETIGYKGFPKVRESHGIVHGYQSLQTPDDLRAFGGEVVARAVNSEPTTSEFWRGMKLLPDQIEEFAEGTNVSMSLSSFTDNRMLADRFALGQEWVSKDIPDGANVPVVFKLEPGAKLAYHDDVESIGFGQFKVVGVEPDSTGIKIVTIRQTSMIEADIAKVAGAPTVAREVNMSKIEAILAKAQAKIEAEQAAEKGAAAIASAKPLSDFEKLVAKSNGKEIWIPKGANPALRKQITEYNNNIASAALKVEAAETAAETADIPIGPKIKDTTIPKSIAEAKNSRQIKNLLEDQYEGLHVIGFEYEDVDLESAKSIAEAFVSRQAAHPQNNLVAIAIDYLEDGVTAETHFDSKTSTIVFNRNFVDRPDLMKKEARKSIASGHLSKSRNPKNPWKDTFDHEWGHVLDFSSNKIAKRSLDPIGEFTKIGDFIFGDFLRGKGIDVDFGEIIEKTPELIKEYEDWVMDGLPSGYSFYKADRKTRKIDSLETVAESYHEALHNPKASPVVKSIYKHLMAAIQETEVNVKIKKRVTK